MKRYALAAIIILLVFTTTLGFVKCSNIVSPLTALEKSDKKQNEFLEEGKFIHQGENS